jgi:DNA polymerase III delta prime subunit
VKGADIIKQIYAATAEPGKHTSTLSLEQTVSLVISPRKKASQVEGQTDDTNKSTKEELPKSQKVLKLNSNGTFGSPPKPKPVHNVSPLEKSKKTSSTTRSKRAARAPNTTNSSPSRIVVLKYEGQSISERLAGILAGTNRLEVSAEIPSASTTAIPPKTVEIVAPKPVAPPKNLHPFFVKPVLKTEAQDISIANPGTPIPGAETAGRNTPITIPGPVDLRIPPTPRSSRPLVKTNASKEAPWPWKGVAHVTDGVSDHEMLSQNMPIESGISSRKKNKGVAPKVANSENILRHFTEEHLDIDAQLKRTPQRQLSTWPEIQKRLLDQFKLVPSAPRISIPQQPQRRLLHPAIEKVFSETKDYLSQWDVNRYESQAWVQKYAPQYAKHVLQDGKEAIILRDWLTALQVNNVDSGKHRKSTKLDEKPKRKKKRKSEMADFIMDEDGEDAFDETDWTDVEDETSTRRPSHIRSQVRRPHPEAKAQRWRPPNSVLLSGPSGCGKTAAVYAVARELGFEVFEINAGSRRSGKDILDRIGDMMENHLVQQVSNAVKEREKAKADGVPPAVSTEPKDGRQGNMNAFFKATGPIASKKSKTVKFDEKATLKSELKPESVPTQQKQSLILFEEVDVLFTEDKQFWTTVIALAAHSKRPIVLTCNEESLVDINSLPLHAILRFVPPSENVACDYLTAIAAREGHFLSQESVLDLYNSTGLDLRASITSLNFWCQMAIGSVKGGLDWMVDRYPVGKDLGADGFPLRAISMNTYQSGQGWLNQDLVPDDRTDYDYHDEQNALSTLIHDMNLSLEDIASNPSDIIHSLGCQMSSLQDVHFLSESLSALDIACQGSTRTGFKTNLDNGHPIPTEKRQQDNVQRRAYLLSESIADHQSFDADMSAAVLTNSRRLVSKAQTKAANNSSSPPQEQQPFDMHSFALSTINSRAALISYGSVPQLTRIQFSNALDILAETGTTDNCILSSFDRAFNIITLDLAPYSRTIARQYLADERDKAALLASAHKKVRLSRVSRTAAEGGRREESRRERRWPKDIDLEAIVLTGGVRWESGGKDGALPNLGSLKLPLNLDNGVLGNRYMSDMVKN